MLDYISKIEQKILRRKLFSKKMNLFLLILQKKVKNRSKFKPTFTHLAKMLKIDT
jgi:hypothetical protein